jgi:hypothetical protein
MGSTQALAEFVLVTVFQESPMHWDLLHIHLIHVMVPAGNQKA